MLKSISTSTSFFANFFGAISTNTNKIRGEC